MPPTWSPSRAQTALCPPFSPQPPPPPPPLWLPQIHAQRHPPATLAPLVRLGTPALSHPCRHRATGAWDRLAVHCDPAAPAPAPTPAQHRATRRSARPKATERGESDANLGASGTRASRAATAGSTRQNRSQSRPPPPPASECCAPTACLWSVAPHRSRYAVPASATVAHQSSRGGGTSASSGRSMRE